MMKKIEIIRTFLRVTLAAIEKEATIAEETGKKKIAPRESAKITVNAHIEYVKKKK